MYILYVCLLLYVCGAAVHKCSNCKYFINGKSQLKKYKIQNIPERCQLYFSLHVEKGNIIKEYLDASICRRHEIYCGKEGKYFIEQNSTTHS